MNNNKIFEKVKMKIAISNVKEEDIVMNKSKLNIIAKGIGIAACIALSMTGVVFASSKIIESIWKNPEKVNPTYEIIDEIRKKNITIDEAKEVAINKLEEVGFNSNIIKQEERKTYNNENIDYLFTTETEYEITIEGSTGQFFAIRNCKEFKQDENKAYTLEEAKEIADKYFKQFGFDKDGFEFTKVQVDVGPDVKKGGEQTRGSRLEVRYNKKYDNQISSSQYVNIVLDTGLEDRFESIMTKNEPFENNEYIITKDEAVSKAKEYDKNITDMKIAETKAEKKIVKINDKAYSRMQNYKEFYEPMQNENFDNSKYNYYAVDEKLRNAWVVVLKYDDKYFTDDVVKRYSEGAFTYYVDATTGEIIGGEILDGLAYSF
ncbi:unknown [Clostridium sp. CAG:356]|jgi:hypothetical protein|nr:MAG: hypothetical protein BHW02_01210 [Clostridium sp. 28_12]CDD36569.1 unknown [Clostridium sp. CAG:356]